MRDYENTAKALRCCRLTSARGCAECPYSLNSNEKCANLLPNAADAIEELIKISRRWELEAAANEKDKQYLVDENRRLVDSLMNLLVQKWISVEKRLPEVDERVLACVGIPGELSVWDGVRWNGEEWESEEEAAYDYWTTIDDPVTHWMPLPEPPKEVQDG